MEIKSQRQLLWASIVLAAAYFFGYCFLMRFFPPPSPALAADDVAKLYAAANLQFKIGVALMLVGGGFFLPWSIVVGVQMARVEQGLPIWSFVQAGAGALGAVLLFLPPIFWGAAAFSPERDAELTKLMHELAFISFITPVSVLPLQAVAVGVVSLAARPAGAHLAFPRWIGFFSMWIGVAFEAGVLALMFKSGPFAWNGLFPFYIPLFAFAIWLTCLTTLIFKELARQSPSAA